MNKSLLSGIALAALVGGQAGAADMAIKSPAPAVVADNWTGFYVGGTLGARLTDSNWTTTCAIPTGFSGCPSFFFEGGESNNPASFRSTSFKGTVFAGYNLQAGSAVVIGVEGDVGFAKNEKTVAGIPGTFSPAFNPASPGTDTATVKETWDASMRLRGGYLVTPSILLFATGGVAWTHLEISAFCGSAFPVGWCAELVGTTSGATANRMGYTVGAGVEGMLTRNWLVRAEYRYADYTALNSTLFISASGIDTITTNVKLRTHTASVGLAYKFDWGAVVASY